MKRPRPNPGRVLLNKLRRLAAARLLAHQEAQAAAWVVIDARRKAKKAARARELQQEDAHAQT